jgi:hypothetical protein
MVLAASGDQRPGRGGVCRRVPLGPLAFAGLLSLTAVPAEGDSSAPAGQKKAPRAEQPGLARNYRIGSTQRGSSCRGSFTNLLTG